MSLKKTAKHDNPHATFALTGAGWEWRVLKTYKAPASESKDPYARWFVSATSPMMHGTGYEMGDTYVRELLSVRPRLISCTREFADSYPNLVSPTTQVVGEPA